MSSDSLHDRGRALEDAFFAAQSEKKLADLRAALSAEEAAKAIVEQTGIEDTAVIQRIVKLGVRPETLAAFALVPLVYVAWADGVVDPEERKAVEVEAIAIGLAKEGPGIELLRGWLASKPDPELFATWKAWHADVVAGLDAEDRIALGAQVLENARRIARSSGGMFGFGSVNPEEHEALGELTRILAPA